MGRFGISLISLRLKQRKCADPRLPEQMTEFASRPIKLGIEGGTRRCSHSMMGRARAIVSIFGATQAFIPQVEL
jgi:hypothetical protein